MYGIHKNYYIVEADLADGELEKRLEKEQKENADKQIKWEIANDDQMKLWEIIDDSLVPKQFDTTNCQGGEAPTASRKRPPTAPLPHSLHQRTKDISSEATGTGLNRKTYFICTSLGEEWQELPSVTPAQLCVARKIKKYFTGELEREICSYPVFPGVEKHYLRATIARITAGSYVSPIGYYRLGSGDDEEEEAEEEDAIDNDKVVSFDPGYEPIGTAKLLALDAWVHHRSHILQQGRVNWFNPKDLEDGGNEDEAEEEEEENEEDGGKAKFEPEIGPALLTPLSEDVATEKVIPWTTQLSQQYNPSNAMVVIRSNVWPGAFSFAIQRVHDCLYVGWGSKYVTRNYSPPSIPLIEEDYLIGPEVMEILDPSVEEEEVRSFLFLC